jgi:thiol-disulfide isomerase/thioredoxin
MKGFLILLIGSLYCQTVWAQQPKTVNISGEVSGDTRGYNYIYFYSGSNPLDSVLITNGKFHIKAPFVETHSLILMTQYAKWVNRSYQTLVLLLDGGGDIFIKMDIEKGFPEAMLMGSSTAIDYVNFRKQQSLVSQKVDQGITATYGRSFVTQNDPLYARLSVSRDSLYKQYMGALVLDFVRTHKHDFLGVFVLTNVGRNILAIEKLETAYQSLSSAQKQTREGKKLAAYVDGVKSSKVGAVVKNFVLNDPNGQPLSFDQYRGKYVWIDFWASWCAPCKKAFPHMKEIYAAYKSRGFEILGISTDAKIEPWLKILPELKNPWPQVWDDKNVMSQFAVTAFPTSFLIDPNGVILLKEIGYDPNGESLLEKKLEAIFGSKVASMAN